MYSVADCGALAHMKVVLTKQKTLTFITNTGLH